MAEVILKEVGKTYPNGFNAIPAVDLHIADGEFIVLVGPSGCGKSTLLRMVAGLESITSGELTINGTVMNKKEPADRDIAMVFQNYALYPHMTVFNNMAYGLKNRGVDKATILKKVNSVGDMLGLEELLDRKPKQLSGGQRQRVAMGRAMVRDPQVFLFDEPLSNLDAKLRVQMRVEIRQLQRKLGTTTLYVTHDQVEAMTLADRLVVLNKGNAEQIGTPLELYERPATPFVAAFIGSPSMNFLKGTLINDGGSALVLADQSQVSLTHGAEHRGEVVLGIRPQDITIDPEHGAPAKVTLIEPTGADTHVSAEMAGQTVSCVLPPRFGYSLGDEIRLSFKSEHVHFFDPVTERRLSSG